MKQVFTLLLVFFISAAHAQFEMGLHYVCSAPVGAMGQNIQPVHSFAMTGSARFIPDKQFFAGAELAFGSYACKTQEQTYTSPEDGSTTMTDVIFSSNIQNYHAIAGYDLAKGTAIIPYVTAKAGISRFSTNIVIEDPDEHHSCHPLEEETVFSDVAFSAGAGAGLKVDASSLFTNWKEGRWWFDFSANYLWGTSLDYVNVKYLNPDEPGPNPITRDVPVKFVDIQTDHVHEHQVAQVYTSRVNLVDFKIGIVKTFGWCGH